MQPMSFVFDPPSIPGVPIAGSTARFPVHRIYCIGRNYADHAKEMGAQTVSRANPVFFMKPADAIALQGGDIPYPPATRELHHEVEMVVGLSAGGRDIAPEHALDCVFGYGVGLDLTRRDLQAAMKAKGLPWDVAKGFDASAPVSALRTAAEIGHPPRARLSLSVNGELRQDADIADMIFAVPEIISELSQLFELKAGDLVFTGTPAGVGPLQRGDVFRASLEDIAELEGRIA
jgi:fumarylpyruvate hydrolase